jgi:hypothetical protein
MLQLVNVYGLLVKIAGTGLDRLEGTASLFVTGNDYDLGGGSGAQDLLQAAEPLRLAVRMGWKTEIEGYDLRPVFPEEGNSLIAVFGKRHLVFPAEPPFQLFAYSFAVVDNQ